MMLIFLYIVQLDSDIGYEDRGEVVICENWKIVWTSLLPIPIHVEFTLEITS